MQLTALQYAELKGRQAQIEQRLRDLDAQLAALGKEKEELVERLKLYTEGFENAVLNYVGTDK